MSFIQDKNQRPPADPIVFTSFWPDLDPDDFSASFYSDITDAAKIHHALVVAASIATLELTEWREGQISKGHNTLAGVPADTVGGVSVKIIDFKQAVYCRAKASLLDTYREIDTTPAASTKIELGFETACQYRKKYYDAMRRIMGLSRSTIELI